ncbi:MAG: hypothetical protein DRP76_04515, partial [Candidatus Omnitrophota bacterium]
VIGWVSFWFIFQFFLENQKQRYVPPLKFSPTNSEITFPGDNSSETEKTPSHFFPPHLPLSL